MWTSKTSFSLISPGAPGLPSSSAPGCSCDTAGFSCLGSIYFVANSSIPFKICLEENIKSFVTIPLLHEFSDLLKIAREGGHIDTVYPWLWEHQIFQNLLAQDYGLQKVVVE